ncbi:hypothetical protein HYPSUDRAFT_89429 [Hypholoma sublateritium FD-334 SS-4]|uniref:Uncharacterized protein n=1 Tax=Hypholoma sublateritium (strain FD-334 SS-4) TaxID=945553 RepID=A0A0D2KYC2_HYPSF|nr:hypothetical protein HYPSUDRAFT_89429 [Hypholoma sublateritium FD-334 SS-4]
MSRVYSLISAISLSTDRWTQIRIKRGAISLQSPYGPYLTGSTRPTRNPLEIFLLTCVLFSPKDLLSQFHVPRKHEALAGTRI